MLSFLLNKNNYMLYNKNESEDYMKELQEKYAKVLLEACLKMDKNQPLFITYNSEREDFVQLLSEVAKSLGITDIYYDRQDPYKKHEALQKYDVDKLKELPYWNRSIWNEYAKKNAAFLMLSSENPGLMKDIDQNKITEMAKYSLETRKEFDNLRDKQELAWCIACVPTEDWAKVLYPKESNPTDKLWDIIFDICKIKEDNPVEIWNNKIKKLNERANKLNSYQFKTLKYKSSNGTNFQVDLPKNHLWASGRSVLKNNKEVLVNYPTEEVFTSPDCLSANGILYSSKPLSYQDVLIDNFSISFKDGKVVDCKAEKGEETLKNMINICENSNMIGEVALVPYDSPISNTNQIFLETLFDENAACHVALGDSFTECIENGINRTKDELFNEYHLNKCDSHVDFMVGNKDLNITGITHDNKEIPILVNGNFTEEFN